MHFYSLRANTDVFTIMEEQGKGKLILHLRTF